MRTAHLRPIWHDWASGHVPKPRNMLGGKHALRPSRSATRNRIEILHAAQSAADAIMVSTHKDAANRAGAIDHLIGIGAVANNITKIPDHVVLRRSPNDSVKRLKIGVDIGKDKGAHSYKANFSL